MENSCAEFTEPRNVPNGYEWSLRVQAILGMNSLAVQRDTASPQRVSLPGVLRSINLKASEASKNRNVGRLKIYNSLGLHKS